MTVETMAPGPEKFALSGDDAVRMRRLYEEVSGKLEEMSLIFTRTVGVPLSSVAVRRFAPEEPSVEADWAVHVQIVCAGPDGPCGCYVEIAGEAPYCEYPCTPH